MNKIKYKSTHGQKITMIGAVVLCTAGLFAGTAQAVAAKFHSAEGSVNGDGELVVAFEERGLGEGDIDYTLSADANALYACINGGGKHPQAANKESFKEEVTADVSFESKNGRVFGSIDAGPPLGTGFTCPSGQRRVLAFVEYTNIVLTDETNGSSISVDDVSRTFFNI
jgi:hypothetical protein